MSALEIISTLRALNLSLSIDGDKLHVQGERGLLTPEMRGQIKAHKSEIMRLICPHCGESLAVSEQARFITYDCACSYHRTSNKEPGKAMRLAGKPGRCGKCDRSEWLYGDRCSACLEDVESPRRVFTFGYAGKNVAEFRMAVKAIDAVVFDIRFYASSKQQGWDGQNLARTLDSRYRHIPAWGNRNFDRRDQSIEIADFGLGWETFRQETRAIILMCGCKDRLRCHRRVIADRLDEIGISTSEMDLQEIIKMEVAQC